LQDSLQATITLPEDALLIFFAMWGGKIAGMGCWGLSPQPLDNCSQSGAYDLSATAIINIILCSIDPTNVNAGLRLL